MVNGARSRETAELVARRSYGKLLAYLVARTRDVAAAEDALSEAFAVALKDWPRTGCPENPEGWLLTVARRRLIDTARRSAVAEAANASIRLIAEEIDQSSSVAEIPDRRLALMFACTNPAIDRRIRAPLMLQVVLGLDAETISLVFLTSPSAMGKRLTRAKEKIRQAGIAFEIPEREQLPERVSAVLDAVYAAFCEGWNDAGDADAMRRDLTGEALFLARLTAELVPDEPEALGLLALILHAHARRAARRSLEGEYVPLAEQDQSLWDMDLIFEAEALLKRVSQSRRIGRYQLEAALQSAHVYRCRTGHANWRDILSLYDALFQLDASPVVAVNRALAIAEVHGASAGLEVIREIAKDKRLSEYQPYWAALADLSAKTGARTEARGAYDIAIGLERDPAVRRFLLNRQNVICGALNSTSHRLF